MGPSLAYIMGLVITQGFVAPKPDSATVLSRSSGNREGSHILYRRYCSCLVFIVSAYLSCASLRGASEYVGMWTVIIIGSQNLSFLGR